MIMPSLKRTEKSHCLAPSALRFFTMFAMIIKNGGAGGNSAARAPFYLLYNIPALRAKGRGICLDYRAFYAFSVAVSAGFSTLSE